MKSNSVLFPLESRLDYPVTLKRSVAPTLIFFSAAPNIQTQQTSLGALSATWRKQTKALWASPVYVQPHLCDTWLCPAQKHWASWQPAELAYLLWRRKYCQEAVTCLFSATHRCAASRQQRLCFVTSTSETETMPSSAEIKSNFPFFCHLWVFWKLCFPDPLQNFSWSYSFGLFKRTYLCKCLWRQSSFFIVLDVSLHLTFPWPGNAQRRFSLSRFLCGTFGDWKTQWLHFLHQAKQLSSTWQLLCPSFN